MGGPEKRKPFWKMKATKDAGEKYNDPEREEDIVRRNRTRLALWEQHLKNPTVAPDEALKCVENTYCSGCSLARGLF